MIFILTGAVHSGKTSLLRRLTAELKELGIGVDGFLSLAALKNREHIGYDFFNLKTETVLPFIRRQGAPNWPTVGPYYIQPEILAEAKRKIISHQARDLLIVDEVGPLEIRGDGLWPALSSVFSRPSLLCLLVARRGILEDLRRLIAGSPVKIFDIENQAVYAELLAEMQEKATSIRLLDRPRRSSKKAMSKKACGPGRINDHEERPRCGIRKS
jgi:nucleoside-triphosphatase THEP1